MESESVHDDARYVSAIAKWVALTLIAFVFACAVCDYNYNKAFVEQKKIEHGITN